jgi:hypothetical protein
LWQAKLKWECVQRVVVSGESCGAEWEEHQCDCQFSEKASWKGMPSELENAPLCCCCC